MSQERFHSMIQDAVKAIKANPNWRPTDQVVIILADTEDTVITSSSGSSLELAGLLRFHAGKMDRIG